MIQVNNKMDVKKSSMIIISEIGSPLGIIEDGEIIKQEAYLQKIGCYQVPVGMYPEIDGERRAMMKIPGGPEAWWDIFGLYEKNNEEMKDMGVIRVDGYDGTMLVTIKGESSEIENISYRVGKYILKKLNRASFF